MDTKSNVRNTLVMRAEWLEKGESLYFDGGRKGSKLYVVFFGEVPGWVHGDGFKSMNGRLDLERNTFYHHSTGRGVTHWIIKVIEPVDSPKGEGFFSESVSKSGRTAVRYYIKCLTD
ncbi:MAG: hypothetical protein J5767_12655 [Paludibacteraceae bacterium]|nr:hypothetical protein [Paludibacteraceae bacterium]